MGSENLRCKQLTPETVLCVEEKEWPDEPSNHPCFDEENPQPLHHERVCLGDRGRRTGNQRSWEQAHELQGEVVHALQDADASQELRQKASELMNKIEVES